MELWEPDPAVMEGLGGGQQQQEEGFSFEDSDRFDEDSVCFEDSLMSEPESICTNWRGWRKQNLNSMCSTHGSNQDDGNITSLMELCAQSVAAHIPFEQVEQTFSPVPENVQLRIAYWSFPDNEEDIRLYSCLANGSPDEFQRGEYLLRAKCIRNVLQIGFHLCATVQPPQSSINKTPCSVAVTFDRCRITSCSCNCGSTAKWCAHVVALCLVRIQQPHTVCLRSPVSESLSRLHRDQLQKFAQYLISELPQQILPTAQRLLDELLSSYSTQINTLSGAPDPTAGPSMSDRSLWYLDEFALNDNIKKTLVKFCGPTPIVYSDVNSLYQSSTEPPAAAEYSSLLRPLRGREPEGIWNLLSIVREMLKRKDSNAEPLLLIVTEQCLAFEQVAVWWYNTSTSSAHLHSGGHHSSSNRPSNNISSEIAQHAAASVCDEIVTLWRLVALDPGTSQLGKDDLKATLEHFHKLTLEIIKRGKYKESQLLLFSGFKPALETCGYDWEQTEITLCSHIVADKKKRKVKTSPSNVESTTGSNDGSNQVGFAFLHKDSGGSSSQQPSFQPRLRKQFEHHKPLHRVPLIKTDTGSASDDSCIERDIENNLHISDRHHHHWEMCESPLDFTSDEGSSVCSPVQFTMSSSDDNEQLMMAQLSLNNTTTTTGGTSSQSNKETDEINNQSDDKAACSSSADDASECRYRNELDALFTRAEALYTHGDNDAARILAVKLAEEMINKPEQFIKEAKFEKGNKAWLRLCTTYACKSLERTLFLCNVLLEYPKHHSLAFRLGLQGLELRRPPASSKALEVKLFHQQGELEALMKRLPIGSREVTRLREKAHALINTERDHHHVLPLMLASFIFDSFCLPNTARNDRPPQTSTSSSSRRSEITKRDEEDGFAAAVNALGFKVNVSEAEHPLLCEGTRKQKGDLTMSLLMLYKDSQHKLRTILDNLLDKSLSPNLRASSAFPTSTPSHKKTSSINVSSPGPSGLLSPPSSSSGGPSSFPSTAMIPAVLDSSDDEDGIDGDLRGPRGDIKSSSCDDDYHPSTAAVCSPPRRDSKLSWRSPTVRPKRTKHCITNVNSSASEEAMLSDTSPRLRRRNLSSTNCILPTTQPSSVQYSNQAWTASAQRYPSSPSSDSGSSSSVDSAGTSSSDNHPSNHHLRSNHNQAVPPPTTSNVPRSPPRNLGQNIFANQIKPNNGFPYRKNRGKNSLSVPNVPNQPSEAAAHFFFELAKNVLVKGGGTSSNSLFMQQPAGNQHSGVNRNMVLAAFEIGLYSLGMHNSVSPNWLSRTYSSHTSWISGQAMEIGSAALQILVTSWEGHLTPPETASLADRASRGRDATVVKRAAELALSCLPHSHALNPNEIQRALLQCKEQGAAMLEKACHAVEQSGRGGGVFPEVLFDVAKQWQWIHKTVNGNPDNSHPQPVVQQHSSSTTTSNNNQMIQQPIVTTATITNQPQIPVGSVVLPGVLTLSDPRLPTGYVTHPPPMFPHGFPSVLDPTQMGVTALPGLHQYAAVHIHPAPTINLLPMAASNLHALQYHPSRAPFTLPPDHPHHHPNQQLHHAIPPPVPQANPISAQLQSAFRVGMLALDLLTKRTEDRPNNKYARNPPYANDVKWVLKLSIKLGLQYVQQFCIAAVGGVSSPFVLQDIALETAKYLSETNNQQVCTNLRLPLLQPIVNKCLQMYIHFINNRLYHIHHSSNDYDDFLQLLLTARNAFCMLPSGIMQFNEILQTIHRSKTCKKELWQKINAALSLN